MVQSFSLPAYNYYGRGSLSNLPEALKKYGAAKVFIVSDQNIASAGLVKRVSKLIEENGLETEKYLDVKPEPTIEDVERCLEKYKQSSCNLIIGIGGGSPLDTAKGVSILAANDGSILDYIGVDLAPKRNVPLFLVPTTAGTGSEVTGIAIFSDETDQMKKGIVSNSLLADVAIVDSDLTISMPPAVTAATGMDALTHAVESYTASRATVQTDLYALKAIKLIGRSLRKAVASGIDIAAREDMSIGSVFAGISLANAGVGAVHACAYPIGGRFGTGHGVTNALLLPHLMKCNLSADLKKFADIACALGEDIGGLSLQQQAERSCQAVFRLSEEIGIPGNLRDFGVTKEDIPGLAGAAVQVTRLMENNAKLLTQKDIETCLYNAL